MGDCCFRLTRQTNDANETWRRLYDRQRLERKFAYFERLTLPSIVNQTDNNWQWHIYYGATMPDEFVQRLRRLCAPYWRILCTPVDSLRQFRHCIKSILEYFANDDLYVTVRLDDDDALHQSFFERLQTYSDRCNHLVSFPNGSRITFDAANDMFCVGSDVHSRNTAVGLAAVQFNVYEAGRHTTVHKRYKVHYDTTPQMYYVACDSCCDTARAFR